MNEKKIKEVIEYVSKMVEAAKEVSESTGWIVHKENYEKLKTTLEALEKQLPEKPVFKRNAYGGISVCPICGASDYGKYCRQCGQRLDWSE